MTLQNTPQETIIQIVQQQKEFFHSGKTLDLNFRRQQLKALLSAIEKFEKPLADALWTDLHKSYQEAYMTEIGLVKGEIREMLHKVGRWSKRRWKLSPLALFPSQTYLVQEPLGNSLIVAPWNYPVQLLLNPLVGAIGAGCTAMLKPSPYVPHVSAVIEEMISSAFPKEYIAVAQGNRVVNQQLLEQRWDIIFFTGSPALGRQVMQAASKNLTPVVLELGGKSPCIIDSSADIKVVAKRLAWAKTLNAGQTCIAPDYILIHKDVQDEFVKQFAKAITELHGQDIRQSQHYVRMVTDKAFDRVSSYLKQGTILYGGRTDASERFIEPTLMTDVPLDSALMTEEIFGPIFPMITIDPASGEFLDQVREFVTVREKPLAFYYFGKGSDGWKLIRHTTSGGGCVNDAIMHIANGKVPFGGVGNSGMGHYHGQESFRAFSHQRTIVKTTTLVDLPFRYMPYGLFKLVKKLL